MTLAETEREELHRRRNEEAMRVAMVDIVERKICDMWGVQYSVGGGHWDELRARRTAMDKLIADQARNAGYWSKIVDRVLTAIVSMGAGALAYKLGLGKS